MSNNKQSIKKRNKSRKFDKVRLTVISIAVILFAVIVIKGNLKGNNDKSNGSDLIIPKNEVTETAKFYPFKVNGTRMEILAVKANDGSIRTAFNTCQICNNSPKAYYRQQGDVLVCQNCKNRFKLDMVEQERGGCNPVPIMKEDKIDNGTNIIISKDYIATNKDLFADNWKTQ